MNIHDTLDIYSKELSTQKSDENGDYWYAFSIDNINDLSLNYRKMETKHGMFALGLYLVGNKFYFGKDLFTGEGLQYMHIICDQSDRDFIRTELTNICPDFFSYDTYPKEEYIQFQIRKFLQKYTSNLRLFMSGKTCLPSLNKNINLQLT